MIDGHSASTDRPPALLVEAVRAPSSARGASAVIAAILASGCYQGVSGLTEDGADDVGGSDGASGEPMPDPGDGSDDDAPPTDPDPCDSAAPDHLRRLTRSQYLRSIHDITGIETPSSLADLLKPTDTPHDAFSNTAESLIVRQSDADAYQRIAEAVARRRFADDSDPLSWVGCTPDDPECLPQFTASIARLAYRRPPTESELQRLLAVAADTPSDAALGEWAPYSTVLEVLLQAPKFVLVLEPSADDKEQLPLDGYQIATRLALVLWDRVPDHALLDRARDGELDDPAGRQQVIAEMLYADSGGAGLTTFAAEWFELSRIENADFGTAPSSEVAEQWRVEARAEVAARLAAHVISGDLRDLYVSRTAQISAPLAELYGVQLDAFARGDDAGRVEHTFAEGSHRGGLFSTAGFLAAYSSAQHASVVQRGAAVRRLSLCTEPPPPPPSVEMGDGTEVDHGTEPACWGCHEMLDPVGWGLDRYDRSGRLIATHEDGTPVREDGTLNDVEGSAFGDGLELGQAVISSPTFARCAITKVMTWATAKPPAAAEQCSAAALRSGFEAGGYRVRDLLGGILASESTAVRVMPQVETNPDA